MYTPKSLLMLGKGRQNLVRIFNQELGQLQASDSHSAASQQLCIKRNQRLRVDRPLSRG